MSNDPDLPPWAAKAPGQPQEKRPAWVIVLATIMLMYGGFQLIDGVATLAGSGLQPPVAETVEASRRQHTLLQAQARAHRAHPGAVRVNAASQVALGLVMLLAVAAVSASDVRARRLTLVAAGAGIVFQVADTIFWFQVMREEIVRAVLADLSAQIPAGAEGRVGVAFGVLEVGKALLWVGFSAVVMNFFGGRRGRLFFGVAADMVRRQPHHGG
jgi:hypothetical protein